MAVSQSVELVKFLKRHGLGSLQPLLDELDMDLPTLLEMDSDEAAQLFDEMDISSDLASRLTAAIEAQQQGGDGSAYADTPTQRSASAATGGGSRHPHGQDASGVTPTDFMDMLLRGMNEAMRSNSMGFPDEAAPLLSACQHSANDVRQAIADGCNVNCAATCGCTALHIAAQCGKDDVVAVLVEAGAALNTLSSHGATPLHEAAEHGAAEVVHVLVQKGADKDAVGQRGRTPLHVAAKESQVECAALLLDHGASNDIADEDGANALCVAAAAGNPDVLVAFTERGLTGGTDKRLPLCEAARAGNGDCLRLLIEAGADLNAVDGRGRTALMWACAEKAGPIAKQLCAAGTDVDRAPNGLTALCLAARGEAGLVRQLLQAGARVGPGSQGDRMPLHEAARMANVPVISLLVESGAEVDAREPTAAGLTPLYIAASNGSLLTVKALLAAGAKVNHPTSRGSYPLHAAAIADSADCLRELLMAGADNSCKDQSGATPLQIARTRHSCRAEQAIAAHDSATGSHTAAAGAGGGTPAAAADAADSVGVASASETDSNPGWIYSYMSPMRGGTLMSYEMALAMLLNGDEEV